MRKSGYYSPSPSPEGRGEIFKTIPKPNGPYSIHRFGRCLLQETAGNHPSRFPACIFCNTAIMYYSHWGRRLLGQDAYSFAIC